MSHDDIWSRLTRAVYIGAAASIAFLQTVRRVVAGHIGPSDFTNSKENDRMLEIDAPQTTVDAMEITAEQKLQFLRCYFSVVRITAAAAY